VYCSKCGSNIADGSAVCPQCGQSTFAAPLAVAGGGAGAIAVPAGAPVVVVRPPYAGFWLRLVAYIVDSLILGLFCVPILAGVGMAMGIGSVIGRVPRGDDPFGGFPPVLAAFIAVCALLGLLGGWLYFALLESSEWQGTAGKKILGLIVTDLQGHRVSFGRASGRHFAKIITSLIPLGIGYILAGITEKKQAIHDMLAGCLVMRK
jgi:uncharacterized RDD family membrane protein YckC